MNQLICVCNIYKYLLRKLITNFVAVLVKDLKKKSVKVETS